MSDLSKVVLCLEKFKSKNLGQNPDNLRDFLMKDCNYDFEEAMKLIDEAIVANIIKSFVLNGKVAYRIIRADSNADDTIILPETQEDNPHVFQNDVTENRNCCTETDGIDGSQTPPDDQQISNILTIIEIFRSSLEEVEKQFMKIEDHMIGLSNPISATNLNITQDNCCIDLLKNRISEFEKQLADKNPIIDCLSAQVISKPRGIQKTISKRSDNDQVNNDVNNELSIKWMIF